MQSNKKHGKQPDIIAITEVKPKNARFILSNADYKIEGYEAHTHNLDSGTGRGIIIYVKSKQNVSILNFTTDFTEHLGIQIRLANRELLTFACIYRSPNSTDENNEQLTTLIHQLDQTNSAYKLLVGDFNYGAISWQDNTATSAAETAFLDCLQNTYMNQHVEEPTRGRYGQNPSILDLIINNDPNIVSHIRYGSPLGNSDHACLVFNINCYKEAEESARKFYLYDKGDYENMTAELRNIEWSKKIGWITDPEEAYTVFTETLSTLCEKYIPTKTVGSGNKYKKSYDKDTVRVIKKNIEHGKATWKHDLNKNILNMHDSETRYPNSPKNPRGTTRRLLPRMWKIIPWSSGNMWRQRPSLHATFLIYTFKKTTSTRD